MAETADIGKQQVAAVYAKALIGAAEKAGSTDAVVDELGSLVNEVLVRYPNFEATLGSPRLGPDEKLAMIDRVFGDHASQELQTFLKVLCQHERLDCLQEVASEARKIRNDLRNKVAVEIVTAHELSDQQKHDIQHELQVKMSCEVDLTHKIDQDIIGGIVVRVGDTVVDGSVHNQLQQMKSKAVKKVVEQIHEDNNNRFAAT